VTGYFCPSQPSQATQIAQLRHRTSGHGDNQTSGHIGGSARLSKGFAMSAAKQTGGSAQHAAASSEYLFITACSENARSCRDQGR
jgi:hypothetical protein